MTLAAPPVRDSQIASTRRVGPSRGRRRPARHRGNRPRTGPRKVRAPGREPHPRQWWHRPGGWRSPARSAQHTAAAEQGRAWSLSGRSSHRSRGGGEGDRRRSRSSPVELCVRRLVAHLPPGAVTPERSCPGRCRQPQVWGLVVVSIAQLTTADVPAKHAGIASGLSARHPNSEGARPRVADRRRLRRRRESGSSSRPRVW